MLKKLLLPLIAQQKFWILNCQQNSVWDHLYAKACWCWLQWAASSQGKSEPTVMITQALVQVLHGLSPLLHIQQSKKCCCKWVSPPCNIENPDRFLEKSWPTSLLEKRHELAYKPVLYIKPNLVTYWNLQITRDMKRNEDRKNSIFDVVSNAPEIEFQAKLTMLVAAKNKKKLAGVLKERYCCLINADKAL